VLEELIGQVLDEKYRIERQLGQGGMGAVYLATHLGTKRPVALKVIAPQFMANPEFVERFKREAETAGRLRHPNVINVTDFGFSRAGSQQLAYLVMEYIDGRTLGEVLEKTHPLPLGLVVDIVEQICLAIDRAHQQGVIHRDLKPDNIWLEPNGRGGYNVKVLDFGLAKLRANFSQETITAPPQVLIPQSRRADTVSEITEIQLQDSALEVSTEIRLVDISNEEKTQIIDKRPGQGITRAGAVLGTPPYMSPEQCSGKTLDARSDIYSLGVIVYQMLCGQTPFSGDYFKVLKQQIEVVPPPLKEKQHDIPESVGMLVMSALSKDPDKRPANAVAFATALRANAHGERELLRQALALYSEYFSRFIRFSLIVYIPMTAGIITLFTGLFVRSLHRPATILTIILIFLLSQFFSSSAGGTIIVPMVAQMLMAPLRPFLIRPALSILKSRLREFLTSSLIAYKSYLSFIVPMIIYTMLPSKIRDELYNSWIFSIFCLFLIVITIWLVKRDLSRGLWLYSPIVILEGKTGREAMVRAKVLVDRLGGSLAKIFPLFVFIVMGVSILSLVLTLSLIKQFYGEFSPVESTILFISTLFGILLCISISLLLSPLITTGYALFYLKSRQAGGETLSDLVGEPSEQSLAVVCNLTGRISSS